MTSFSAARPPPTPPTSAPAAPPSQAEALALLGNLFARQETWRPALDAYRASLDRRDDEDTRKIYEDMREKHGFRILDYKVDNESSSPRACFTFSESLARKTDFSPYVAVAGAANSAISSEDQQICVEGLKHGERYAIVIREGLPSAVGESLLKSADYEIYVRDRSPQAHFAGKAYVLPRQGQLGAPLTTVNTSKVADRRLPDRRPQSHRPDFARRFPQADHALAGERDRDAGRREGVERLDGRRFASSTRTWSPIFRSSRRSANCSRASISSPRGRGRARRRRAAIPPTKGMTRRWRRSGWSSPISA